MKKAVTRFWTDSTDQYSTRQDKTGHNWTQENVILVNKSVVVLFTISVESLFCVNIFHFVLVWNAFGLSWSRIGGLFDQSEGFLEIMLALCLLGI